MPSITAMLWLPPDDFSSMFLTKYPPDINLLFRLQIGLIDRSQIDPRRLMPTETGSYCHNVQRIEIDKNGTNLLARTGWESSVHLFLSIPAVMSPGHRSLPRSLSIPDQSRRGITTINHSKSWTCLSLRGSFASSEIECDQYYYSLCWIHKPLRDGAV